MMGTMALASPESLIAFKALLGTLVSSFQSSVLNSKPHVYIPFDPHNLGKMHLFPFTDGLELRLREVKTTCPSS